MKCYVPIPTRVFLPPQLESIVLGLGNFRNHHVRRGKVGVSHIIATSSFWELKKSPIRGKEGVILLQEINGR